MTNITQVDDEQTTKHSARKLNIRFEREGLTVVIQVVLFRASGNGAAGQIGEVQRGRHGNAPRGHLEDDQQSLSRVGDALWCLG